MPLLPLELSPQNGDEYQASYATSAQLIVEVSLDDEEAHSYLKLTLEGGCVLHVPLTQQAMQELENTITPQSPSLGPRIQ